MTLSCVSIRFLFHVGVLYVWRSWRSTLALAAMVFAAVAALVFLSALAEGTNDAMINNSVGLFSGHIAGENLPADYDFHQLYRKGVKHVLPRWQKPAWLKNGENRNFVILMGIEPDLEKKAAVLWKKTVAGRFLQPGEAAIYLSEFEANSLHAGVGDKIRVELDGGLPDMALTVCGTYSTGIFSLDQGIAFCPAEFFPKSGGTMSVAIFLEEGIDPEKFLVNNFHPVDGIHFKSWYQFMPDLKQLIDLNYLSMGIVMMLVLFIVSMGIACAFIVFIVKNLREHGIMKAMGMSPLESAILILTQAMVLTVLASVAGTIAGVAAAAGFGSTGIDLTSFTSYNQYFAVSGIIYPRLTFYSLALPPLMGVIFGCLGAVWPMVYVIRSRAAEVLRSI
jgi:ABC-type lipoprotein release transport system permease subunit